MVTYEVVDDHDPADTEGVVRVAALGDIHAAVDSPGVHRGEVAELRGKADVLLISGDLTCIGDPAEAAALADELADAPFPVAAVLGNHDHHSDRADAVAKELEAAGVHVLEGTTTMFDVRGTRVGVAGVKGFGGGFGPAALAEFGEPEIKRFARHAKETADALEEALTALAPGVRIALVHYAPVEETLRGERQEIYPFMGSSLLGDAIDRAGADLVIHGHAHGGTEKGNTPGGIPVRNAAFPVIGGLCRVYCLRAKDAA
jgi:Icc-related predicted phosphoesterase